MEYDLRQDPCVCCCQLAAPLSYVTITNALYTLAQQYHIHWGECSYRYSVSCCEVTPTASP